jgi:hypothetical protein
MQVDASRTGAPGGGETEKGGGVGLINETAEEETVGRAGRTRRPIYLPNNLPDTYLLLSCNLARPRRRCS